MKVIYAKNPDHGLATALHDLVREGVRCESRNGPVLRFSTPVTSVYMNPTHRVSFNTVRDANPFLHLMESLWMLAGRNDVEFAAYYAKQMLQYSDDGKTLNGAYGYRWRHHFGYDQLEAVIAELKKTAGNSRRCVVQMWDASREFYTGEDSWAVKREADLLNQTSKDLPCNTAIMFDAQLGVLNMTVVNRSNDTIWGCYGANAVHFSILHEYMADRTGIPIGTYYQVSNNLHVYTDFEISQRFLTEDANGKLHTKSTLDRQHDSPSYSSAAVTPVFSHTLEAGSPGWDTELHTLVDNYRAISGHPKYTNDFLAMIARPMCVAYNMWKEGRREAALNHLVQARYAYRARFHVNYDNDWLLAGVTWMTRRINKEQQA